MKQKPKPNPQPQVPQNVGVVDARSTKETFDRWCEECGDDLYDYYGVLSIGGSDGISLSNTKVGRALYSHLDDVDKELEDNGYYEDGVSNMGTCPFDAPTKRYKEWFIENYGTPANPKTPKPIEDEPLPPSPYTPYFKAIKEARDKWSDAMDCGRGEKEAYAEYHKTLEDFCNLFDYKAGDVYRVQMKPTTDDDYDHCNNPFGNKIVTARINKVQGCPIFHRNGEATAYITLWMNQLDSKGNLVYKGKGAKKEPLLFWARPEDCTLLEKV